MAGSGSRGAAGENILSRALSQLPPDLLETNAAFGGRVVEYALRLPGGRLLPIDSKWTSAAELERLETTDDPGERRRLREQVARDVRARVREMAKYLDPERTLSLAVLAVPDAVHAAAPEAHAEGWREGVLVVPYSLALPFVLVLYRLAVRFGAAPEARGARRPPRAGSPRASGAWTTRWRGASRGPSSSSANARDDLRGELAGARASRSAWCPTAEAGAAVGPAGLTRLRGAVSLPRIMPAVAILVAAGRGERMGAGPPEGLPRAGRAGRCSCAPPAPSRRRRR